MSPILRPALPAELPRLVQELVSGVPYVLLPRGDTNKQPWVLAPSPAVGSSPSPSPAVEPGRGGTGDLGSGGITGGVAVGADWGATYLPPELAAEALEAMPDGGVVVATSGSTATPRRVLLPVAALVAAATASTTWLGAPGRWLSALPLEYVAGLMTVVRAAVGGITWGNVNSHLTDLAAVLAAEDTPAYLSIVPTQLHRALADPALVDALRRCQAVLVGGSRLDPALRQQATAAKINLVTTYGMSETAGGVVYNGQPLPGVEIDLLPLEPEVGEMGRVGGPLPRVKGRPTLPPTTILRETVSRYPSFCASEAKSQNPLLSPASEPGRAPCQRNSRPGSSPGTAIAESMSGRRVDEPVDHETGGRIVITSPTVALGYLGQPEVTATVFGPLDGTRSRFLTADRGSWNEDRLAVLGRLDDVIISGGVKVDLTEIQRHCDTIWGAGKLVVFAVADSRWGARMMAATIESISRDDMVRALGGIIVSPAGLPGGLMKLDAWPELPSGKIDRRQLVRWWEEGYGDRQ